MSLDPIVIDPDCVAGKCGSCVGGPCEHHCHAAVAEPVPAEAITAEDLSRGYVIIDGRACIVPAMCECSHHWSVHGASGQTANTAICHGITGSATPGPYEKCRCAGFAPSQDRPSNVLRTGEPVKLPLTLTADARVEPKPTEQGTLPAEAVTAGAEAIQAKFGRGAYGSLTSLREPWPDDLAATALEAAAPAIRAAERERIRPLLLARVDKFERDLGFTAPELYPMRIALLKDAIVNVTDPDPDEDDEGCQRR